MPGSRKAEIHGTVRKFDEFFKVDEVDVSYQKFNGDTCRQRQLVFERGDAAAVLLYDPEDDDVVLVNQFKVPTLVARRRDNPKAKDGWITETVAGMIDGDETPEDAVIRETMEETGYRISNPERICTFFSSPGGTSERIFLFFAKISKRDKVESGGGIDDEDIAVVRIGAHELFGQLANKQIEDPKLAIATYWLQHYVRRMPPLEPSTVKFQLATKPDRFIGYKTGSIEHVTDVDVWVNSENTDMLMDRIIGKTISARIRYLGAKKEDENRIDEDTIEQALRGGVGERGHVRIGTVLVTVSGMLANPPWRVGRIFHVATVEGGPGEGVRAELGKLSKCVKNLLAQVDFENTRLWRLLRKNFLRSIIIPLLGTGDGGLTVEAVAQELIPVAVDYLQDNPDSLLKEIYFTALKTRDRSACDRVLRAKCAEGVLKRVETP